MTTRAAERLSTERNERRVSSRAKFALVVTAEVLMSALLAVPGFSRTFWRDETFSAVIAHQPLNTVWDIILSREGSMAPYYLMLHFWSRLGDGEVWLRLP